MTHQIIERIYTKTAAIYKIDWQEIFQGDRERENIKVQEARCMVMYCLNSLIPWERCAQILCVRQSTIAAYLVLGRKYYQYYESFRNNCNHIFNEPN